MGRVYPYYTAGLMIIDKDPNEYEEAEFDVSLLTDSVTINVRHKWEPKYSFVVYISPRGYGVTIMQQGFMRSDDDFISEYPKYKSLIEKYTTLARLML